ncbi:MAG: hypothetical protein IH784_02415 [Bacteroidetes bacterium]|nr:hypothetical protein [Bacteroidota bacterium]
MIDTTTEAEKIQSELFDKMTGEERMKIASDMFDTARTLVIASLDKNLNDTEKRKALFLRFYGNDFSEDEKEKILLNL